MSLTKMGTMSGCARKTPLSQLLVFILLAFCALIRSIYFFTFLYFPSRIPPLHEENTHMQIPGH